MIPPIHVTNEQQICTQAQKHQNDLWAERYNNNWTINTKYLWAITEMKGEEKKKEKNINVNYPIKLKRLHHKILLNRAVYFFFFFLESFWRGKIFWNCWQPDIAHNAMKSWILNTNNLHCAVGVCSSFIICFYFVLATNCAHWIS